MQCVSRAGPSRTCTTFSPLPMPPNTSSSCDFKAVELELAMAAMLLRPHDLDAAHDAPAGLVLVNRNVVMPLRLSSEVRAARMKCAAPSAPVMNHLRPWIFQMSPCFSA